MKSSFSLLALSTATLVATPAHAIVSTSSPSNLTTGSLNSQTGLSSSALDGVANLSLSRTDGMFGCTGALLSGGAYVLTAAHCVTDGSGNLATSGVSLSFANGMSAHVSSSSQISVYGSWNGTLGNNNDLALLRLDGTVTGTTGYSFYTADPLGQNFLLAGYGMVGTGSTGATGGAGGQLHWGMNEYDGRYSSTGSYLWDFDNGSSSQNTLSKVGYRSSLGLGSLEGSIAPGDSGGPSFIQLGQQLFLAGVHSFDARYGTGDIDTTQDYSYGEVGGDTALLSAQRSWISSFATASAVPEPASGWLMLGGGLATLLARRRSSARPAAS